MNNLLRRLSGGVRLCDGATEAVAFDRGSVSHSNSDRGHLAILDEQYDGTEASLGNFSCPEAFLALCLVPSEDASGHLVQLVVQSAQEVPIAVLRITRKLLLISRYITEKGLHGPFILEAVCVLPVAFVL